MQVGGADCVDGMLEEIENLNCVHIDDVDCITKSTFAVNYH